MDFKAFLGRNDRKTIIENCVGGEEAAIDAYKNVWHTKGLTAEAYSMIIKQHAILKASHNNIKAIRDV